MADDFLVPIGHWQDENATMSQLLSALNEMRAHARAATRISVVNLVVVVADDDAAQRALNVLAELGARHPARTVVFVVEPEAADQPQCLSARATLYGSYISGHPVCSDVVQLKAHGATVKHLDSLLEPLQLVDVPTAVWYFETEPTLDDLLLHLADSVIVDTKELGAQFALASIDDVAQQHTVVDLSWLRLLPWRELLANLFEGQLLRPYINGVKNVHISGKKAPRRLLSGWLCTQLKLSDTQLSVEDDVHVSIRITCEHDGSEAEFVVERESDQRVVHACVSINGEMFYEERVGLNDHPLSYSLTQALMNLSPNLVFEHALHAGLRIEAAA